MNLPTAGRPVVTAKPIFRLALPLLALALAACSPTRSPEPRQHVLLALAEAPATHIGTTIGVGPVRVAAFLEGMPLTVHDGDGALSVSTQHRWSEPLDQGIQRVVVQNLATLTEAKLRNFPWRQRATPQLAIRLDVLDFDRRADGTALLDVIWHLENLGQERLSRSRRERFTVPAEGGFEALPPAYSQLLLQLSERLLAAIQAELGQQGSGNP